MLQFEWDDNRKSRTGIGEAIFCESKTVIQLNQILNQQISLDNSVLLTRLSLHQYLQLDVNIQKKLDYCEDSHTAFLNFEPVLQNEQQDLTAATKPIKVGIITAGTSDFKVAKEAQRTLLFNQIEAEIICDVGVAGIHRLLNKIDMIRQFPVLIACAGMEGALFSVLAGLTQAPVIAVPTSVGYGVSTGGKTALDSALASCSPGIMTVNIDNGFGAACAVIKLDHALKQWR